MNVLPRHQVTDLIHHALCADFANLSLQEEALLLVRGAESRSEEDTDTVDCAGRQDEGEHAHLSVNLVNELQDKLGKARELQNRTLTAYDDLDRAVRYVSHTTGCVLLGWGSAMC